MPALLTAFGDLAPLWRALILVGIGLLAHGILIVAQQVALWFSARGSRLRLRRLQSLATLLSSGRDELSTRLRPLLRRRDVARRCSVAPAHASRSIWPNRGGPIETTFKQELEAELARENPDYKQWMISVTYEIEARTAARLGFSWLLGRVDTARDGGAADHRHAGNA